ncbi:hypothetical protein D3C72_2322230 [compost metagenome]
MRSKGVATLDCGKFRLLHFFNIVLHAFATCISMCQIEHVEPHAVDTGQRDELVFVAHGGQRVLETGDSLIVQVLFPVERR